MYFLYIIHICLTISLSLTNGYVLLAANIDDFRSIAKQFVPGKLADQLVEMVSESTNRYKTINFKQPQESDEVYYAVSEQTEKSAETYEETKETGKTADMHAKKGYSTKDFLGGFNLEVIVEKVKKRLEKDYKLKPVTDDRIIAGKYENHESVTEVEDKDYENNKPLNIKYATFSTRYKSINKYTPEPSYLKFSKDKSPHETMQEVSRERISKKLDKFSNNYYEHYNNYNENQDELKRENSKVFDMVHMLKSNDSYEDYVTPKKFQVFENKEVSKYPKRFNIKADTNTKAAKLNEPNFKNQAFTDYDYEATPGEIKARTEDLHFEDREIIEVHKKATGKVDSKDGKNSKPGTMIPTREFYKMSSPNYYAKVPNIAQKYDFNEPIPERDREPENLKPIGNPPASINRKIKLV